MASRDADIAEQMARSVELDVLNGATKAYYDLWMTHQNILIYSRDKELIEHFAKIAETKYGLGQVSQPDVLRAQVERTRLINRVNTETISAESGAATLTAFLSDTEDFPVGVPDTPPPPSLPTPLDELLALALKTRPELAAQDAAIAREEEGVRLAKLNYLPDFEVSGGRFINAHGGDGVGAMTLSPSRSRTNTNTTRRLRRPRLVSPPRALTGDASRTRYGATSSRLFCGPAPRSNSTGSLPRPTFPRPSRRFRRPKSGTRRGRSTSFHSSTACGRSSPSTLNTFRPPPISRRPMPTSSVRSERPSHPRAGR